MSKNFENKIFRMAEKETIGLPEEFDNRIDDLLKELSQQRKIRKISLKAAVILAAALTLAISTTAVAAVNLYQQRMEAMNREKLEKYFADIYKGGSADTKNRDYMDTEKERMAQLQQSYEAEGLFPERELKIIDEMDDYKGKGVAFLPKRSAFFLPEKEMTEEELLQIIDFNHKRDYSLTKINELISSGQMTLPEADVEEVIPTDQSVLGSEAVWEPTQELTVPYEGELEISVIQAGYADRIALSKTASGSVDAVQGYNGEIFLAGYDGEIHKMAIGSSQSKLFFDNFGDFEIKIDSMTQAKNGLLYVGFRKYDRSGNPLSLEVWSIDTNGGIVKKLDLTKNVDKKSEVGISINIIKKIAVDEDGYLYLRTSGEDILTVYDMEGNLVSHVRNDEYTSHLSGGIGIGKDGKAYTYITGKDTDDIGIASIDPVNGKLDQIYASILPGKVMPLAIVAPGVDTDFVFWGYDGIFTYNKGDREAKQIMQPYEAPCQWEGCRAAALPDGRIVFCASTEYNEINLNGSQQVRRKPESTSFFYSVTAGK